MARAARSSAERVLNWRPQAFIHGRRVRRERAASNSEEDEDLSKEAAEVENLKKELDDFKRERELAQQDNGIAAELRKEIAAANAMCAELRTQLDKALRAKEESYARGLELGMTRAFNTSG